MWKLGWSVVIGLVILFLTYAFSIYAFQLGFLSVFIIFLLSVLVALFAFHLMDEYCVAATIFVIVLINIVIMIVKFYTTGISSGAVFAEAIAGLVLVVMCVIYIFISTSWAFDEIVDITNKKNKLKVQLNSNMVKLKTMNVIVKTRSITIWLIAEFVIGLSGVFAIEWAINNFLL